MSFLTKGGTPPKPPPCRALSVEFQLLNLPCQLPPLQRDRNERGPYTRIMRLCSQTFTLCSLIKVSFDSRIQTAALRFLKNFKYLPPSR
jgi:hypothetical protein